MKFVPVPTILFQDLMSGVVNALVWLEQGVPEARFVRMEPFVC
jgi:hypothetical protein